MEVHRFTDGVYTTATWRTAYAESINPITSPESEWHVPVGLNLRRFYNRRQESVLVDQEREGMKQYKTILDLLKDQVRTKSTSAASVV